MEQQRTQSQRQRTESQYGEQEKDQGTVGIEHAEERIFSQLVLKELCIQRLRSIRSICGEKSPMVLPAMVRANPRKATTVWTS